MIDSSRQKELMREAVNLARLGKGLTAPNPCVGALLVNAGGQVMARGWHQCYGQAHAEVNALEDAVNQGLEPSDLSLVVTLEPCSHQGKTGPCAQAVLAAGIRRVFIGTLDPNPQASGGAAFLRAHGLEVITGVEEELCRDLIADFCCWQRTDRPYTILKMATTLDGKIATRTGDSAWVSSEESRHAVHELRAQAQAVLVGGQTFWADNPALTCRLDCFDTEQPLAVVLSSRLPEPDADFQLLRDRPHQLVFLTGKAVASSLAAQKLRAKGVQVQGVETCARGISLADAFAWLRRKQNVFTLLIEGGGGLGLSCLEQGCVDEVQLFVAMKVLGDDQGRSVFSGRNVQSMRECLNMQLVQQATCGPDLWLRLKPADFFAGGVECLPA